MDRLNRIRAPAAIVTNKFIILPLSSATQACGYTRHRTAAGWDLPLGPLVLDQLNIIRAPAATVTSKIIFYLNFTFEQSNSTLRLQPRVRLRQAAVIIITQTLYAAG